MLYWYENPGYVNGFLQGPSLRLPEESNIAIFQINLELISYSINQKKRNTKEIQNDRKEVPKTFSKTCYLIDAKFQS